MGQAEVGKNIPAAPLHAEIRTGALLCCLCSLGHVSFAFRGEVVRPRLADGAQVPCVLRSSDPPFRFLLESVQNIHCLRKQTVYTARQVSPSCRATISRTDPPGNLAAAWPLDPYHLAGRHRGVADVASNLAGNPRTSRRVDPTHSTTRSDTSIIRKYVYSCKPQDESHTSEPYSRSGSND